MNADLELKQNHFDADNLSFDCHFDDTVNIDSFSGFCIDRNNGQIGSHYPLILLSDITQLDA